MGLAMETLQLALYAQLIWFAAATFYNLLSMRAIASGNSGWSGASPARTELFVLLFAAVIMLGLFKQYHLYRWAALLVAPVLFAGGVLRHFLAPPKTYASSAHRAWAIGINLFGVGSFLAGSIGAWRLHE
ncbi:MAG: hypothetical protein ACI82N_000535 [Maricaulis sp.]|jgi:hypothetical protein